MNSLGIREFKGIQQMINENGGHQTAKKLINKPGTEGLTALLLEGRPDLSVENLALDYPALFTEKELQTCKERTGRI